MTTPADSFLTYRPSGRVSWRTLPVLLFAGIPAALLLGWIYANVLSSSSWMGFSILISGFSSTLIAIATFFFLTQSHSRSVRFNGIAAGGMGFIALWARWITMLALYHLSHEAITFATSGPLGWFHVLHDFAAFLNTQTAEKTSGSLLAVGWTLEGVFMVAMSAAIGKFSAQEPYSESAKAWAKKGFSGELFWPDGHSDELLYRLKQQGPTKLLQLLRASSLTTESAIGSEWWTVFIEGYWVESDPAARWLNVSLVIHRRDSEGKIKSQRTPLLEGWQVSHPDYAAVAAHLTHQDDKQVSEDASLPSKDGSTEERPTAVELMPAVTALEAENFTAAITLAQAHCQHPSEEVRADAHRLCALAQARLRHWDDAFTHYHALFEIEPTAFNAMQLAATSVTCGQLVRGHAWFEKAEEINQHSHEIQPPKMRTQFISALELAGELAAAKPHLDRLADAYRLAKTTDSQQLWNYGLPFFSTFLEKSLPILRSCCAEQDIKAWYESMRGDLDEDGKVAIDEHLALAAQPCQR